MRGKVKFVRRTSIDRIGSSGWHRLGFGSRLTVTCAHLYNGDQVRIDEKDIRDYYDYDRITKNLIERLSNDFHNVWIDYYEDDGYCLDGCIGDYL